VVLLHGIARSSASLKRIERALRASGFATLNIDYASRSKPIAALADDIHPAIARFAEREHRCTSSRIQWGVSWPAPISRSTGRPGLPAS
jgi:hypothetical protein